MTVTNISASERRVRDYAFRRVLALWNNHDYALRATDADLVSEVCSIRELDEDLVDEALLDDLERISQGEPPHDHESLSELARQYADRIVDSCRPVTRADLEHAMTRAGLSWRYEMTGGGVGTYYVSEDASVEHATAVGPFSYWTAPEDERIDFADVSVGSIDDEELFDRAETLDAFVELVRRFADVRGPLFEGPSVDVDRCEYCGSTEPGSCCDPAELGGAAERDEDSSRRPVTRVYVPGALVVEVEHGIVLGARFTFAPHVEDDGYHGPAAQIIGSTDSFGSELESTLDVDNLEGPFWTAVRRTISELDQYDRCDLGRELLDEHGPAVPVHWKA